MRALPEIRLTLSQRNRETSYDNIPFRSAPQALTLAAGPRIPLDSRHLALEHFGYNCIPFLPRPRYIQPGDVSVLPFQGRQTQTTLSWGAGCIVTKFFSSFCCWRQLPSHLAAAPKRNVPSTAGAGAPPR